MQDGLQKSRFAFPVLKFIRSLGYKRFEARKSLNKHLELYSSYVDALKVCTKDGYEENELIKVVYQKTLNFIEETRTGPIPVWDTASYSLLALLHPVLSSDWEKDISVIDFGGACGAHYFHFKAFCENKIKVRWAIVETPAMVRAGSGFKNEELSFSDDLKSTISGFDKIDLLHTSGTIQCLEAPYQMMDEILDSGAKYILFNRLGLNRNDRDVTTIHTSMLSWNGIGSLPEGFIDKEVRYPFTFLSERKFMEMLSSKYEILTRFSDPSGYFPIIGEDITGYGLLCRIKSVTSDN